MRCALGLEYDGSGFSGWQIQSDEPTVQARLESAISVIAGAPIRVHCAGRTDTGVHASMQVVHFDPPDPRPLSAWVRGVNAHLPAAIAVRWATPVSDEFHARFSATGRRYQYILINRPVRSALLAGRAGWFHRPLDAGLMNEAAQALLGEHDFSSFRAAGCQAASPVRTLRSAAVRRLGDCVILDFAANAFLHHMVRNMVGALVSVGQGARPPEWIGELLALRDRRLAAPTFSPSGLYLCGVDYPERFGLPAETAQAATQLLEHSL